MGFGAASRTERLPPMVLIGILPCGHNRGPDLLRQERVDAILFKGPEVKESPSDQPWGLWPSQVTPEAVKGFRERGCDFLVSGPEGAAVEALEEDGMALLLAIPADMDDRLLRSIEGLPVDGVFLQMGSLAPPLTLQHLMDIASIRAMFEKYLVVEVPAGLTARELEALRDLGVDGLAVDASALPDEELRELRERLLGLPRQRRARRVTALLPRIAQPPSPPPGQEEEEEEEG